VQHLRITQLQSAQAAQVQHLAQVQRNLDDAKRAQAATDAALSGRITAAQTLLATRKKTNATIQQVLQSQPAAHAWADSPIPDGILGELRQ
jgi:type II secretory pathway component PulM